MGTPEWVFRWRGSRQPFFPRLVALALVTAGFTFLISPVKIRVDAPGKSAPRKASVIYLNDDAEGRALSLRAQEGGPFPSRFVLSQWSGLAEMEAAGMEAARYQPPSYEPRLQDLPMKNEKLKIAPVLYPLSGITAGDLPRDLPPFDAVVDSAMSSASWRFLARLNPDGGVAECVSLKKGGEAGASELEAWLHKIRFQPDPAKPFRWISVGIGFTNQPADGTDAR
jgi:hypothetical protein